MIRILKRTFQYEDMFLMLWLLLVEPLLNIALMSELGGVKPNQIHQGEANSILLGMLYLSSATIACICVATRVPDGPNPFNFDQLDNYARLPMLTGISFMYFDGFGLLGIAQKDLILPFLLLFCLIIYIVSERLPRLSLLARRILITPFLLVGTWLFTSLIHTALDGMTLQSLLDIVRSPLPFANTTPNTPDWLLWILLLFFLFVPATFFFYLVYVLAPRQVAQGGGSWTTWIMRYCIYIIGILLNISWLQRL